MSLIFVSHASEDKESLVRPLAHALKAQGLKVWYDEFSLRPGDSLRRSIDKGLAECAAGVIVLSPSFFAKEWPQRELDALFSAEISGRTRLIPIWHQIEAKEIAEISPLLVDRVALRSAIGIEEIANKIAEQFPPPQKFSGDELATLIEGYMYPGIVYGSEAYLAGCKDRFLRMNAFKEECTSIWDEAINDLPDTAEDVSAEVQEQLNLEEQRLKTKYRIPENVYLTNDEPDREENYSWWMEILAGWVSGTLTPEESSELVLELDMVDLDEYYILLGIPNFSISREQRPLLEMALVELGCGFESDYAEIEKVCTQLRALDASQ